MPVTSSHTPSLVPDKMGARKRKGTGRNMKRGKLRAFVRLPMELILQICGYLLPKDLLHLARVNKEFRVLFMSRSSQLLWKTVLQNIEGLPSCPQDMCEPAYAELVTFSSCHECSVEHSKKTGVTLYFEARMRLCAKCWSSGKRVKAIHSPEGTTKHTLRMLFPKAEMSEDHASLPATAVLSDFHRDLWNGDYDAENQRSTWCFAIIKTEYEELRKAMTKGTPHYRKEYIEGRTQYMAEIREHKARWDYYVCARRMAEAQRIRDDQVHRRKMRNQRLEEKLRESDLEYIEGMLMPSDQRTYHFRKLLKWDCVAKLNDKAWKKLEPRVVSFLRSVAVEELPERFDIINSVVEHIVPSTSAIPSFLDIIMRCGPITDLLLKKTSSFKEELVLEHCHAILAFIKDWSRSYIRGLEDHVRQELKLSDLPNPTSLVIGNIFACIHCGQLTDLTGHVCLRYPLEAMYELYDLTTPGKKILVDVCYDIMLQSGMPLSNPTPEHLVSLASRLAPIVSAHDLDPYTASVKDMDKSPICVQCGPCKLSYGLEQMMDWREAIIHAQVYHTDRDCTLCWIPIEDRTLWGCDIKPCLKQDDDSFLCPVGWQDDFANDAREPTVENAAVEDTADTTSLYGLDDLLHENAWMQQFPAW